MIDDCSDSGHCGYNHAFRHPAVSGLGGLRREDGFTLIEVMLAMVIAAALMAVLLPNFGPAIDHAKLSSATREVASALRYTRGQALIHGGESFFELDISGHKYRVSGRNKTFRLPDSVDLSLYTAESETQDEDIGNIRFFPDGSSTGGRVTLSGGGQKRLVDVSWLTGEVKIIEDADEEE